MAKRNKFNGGQPQQRKLADNLDELAEFEDFKAEVLPQLRKAIKAGKTADQIYAMVTALAAGKIATLALTTKDTKEALALCTEILNRSQGKAREKVEVTTRYEQMSDAELEALIKQQEADEEESSQLDS